MKEIIAKLHDIKYLVAVAGALAAFLFDRNLGPSEDDFPLRAKILLAAPILFAVSYSLSLGSNQKLSELVYAFGFLVIAILTYMIIWLLFGYTKTVVVPRPWWRPWGGPYTYKSTRVMGGVLKQQAKQRITQEHITPQSYFEGMAYDQDSVWNRGSRAALQGLLFLVYLATIFFYTLTVALAIG